MHPHTTALRTLVIAALVIAAACKSDSTGPGTTTDPGNGTAVNLKGTLVGQSLSGDIDITIAATGSATTVPITGCLYLKTAACVSAPGTYTKSSKAISFATSSPALAFTGTYSGGVVHGSFTGSDAGGFVVRNGTVTVYCGTFSGAASGTWNFVISGSTLDGVYDDGSGTSALTGTVSGSSLSITYSGGTAAGTLSGASASGTWTAGTASGSWTGSSGSCRT